MGRPKGIPKYEEYKARGCARVRIDGRAIYIPGPYGSADSRAEYDRIVAEYLAARGALTPPAGPDGPGTSVDDLLLAYLLHARAYYRGGDGRPTAEVQNLTDAVTPVSKLYGETPAAEFGPLALEAARAAMVRSGLARTTINARVHRIRRAFRWAASRELIPPSVVQALDTVAALKKNRTEAPEPPPVLPPPPGAVERTIPFLPAPVVAMVRLQLLAGMRPGEAMAMKAEEIDRSAEPWTYRPAHHKGGHRGKGRSVPLGPRARAILAPFLEGRAPDAYLFDPREAVGAHHARRAAARKSARTPCEQAKLKKGRPGETRCPCYDRRTYRQAVVRACRRAAVEPWSPLQLRHAAATEIRARYGLEAAQVALGHARADVTQVYAERDEELARRVAEERG